MPSLKAMGVSDLSEWTAYTLSLDCRLISLDPEQNQHFYELVASHSSILYLIRVLADNQGADEFGALISICLTSACTDSAVSSVIGIRSKAIISLSKATESSPPRAYTWEVIEALCHNCQRRVLVRSRGGGPGRGAGQRTSGARSKERCRKEPKGKKTI